MRSIARPAYLGRAEDLENLSLDQVRSDRPRRSASTPRQSDRWRQHRRRQKSALRALRWFRHRPAGSADQASPPDGPRPRTGRRTAAWFATAFASTRSKTHAAICPPPLSACVPSRHRWPRPASGGRRARRPYRRDRQLDAGAPERQRSPVRAHFGDHAHAGEDYCNDWPRPSSRPTWRFRLRSPVEVNTRSPRPLKPASVSRRRLPHRRAGKSAVPRVIRAGHGECPKPSPSTTPAAMAMTFFIAPPISTPGTSSLTSGAPDPETIPARRPPPPRDSKPTRAPSAAPAQPHAAKLGPESTTTGCSDASSASTVDMR